MTNRLYAILAPVVAIAAFTMVPTVAQGAAQHWYKCEKFENATHNRKDIGCTESTTTGHYELERLPYGETHKIPVVLSGDITISTANLTESCSVHATGSVWNTIPAGEGDIEEFAFSKCFTEVGTCLELGIVMEKLPYGAALAAGPVDEIHGIQMTLSCSGKTRWVFTGTLTPKIINGTSPTKPTVAEFTLSTGELKEGSESMRWEGELEITGAEHGEGIQVESP
jgi:hypothetical protein